MGVKCELCNDSYIAKYINNIMTACPACDFQGFQRYLDRKEAKVVSGICLGCQCIVPGDKPRCLPCHNIYKEMEILCDECGAKHHKAKFKMCYYCNLKKTLKKNLT